MASKKRSSRRGGGRAKQRAAGGGRSALRRLADRVGIVAEYVDQTGKERRVTSDETRAALLAAMGIDAADDEAARRALKEVQSEDARQGRGPDDVPERCLTPHELLGGRRVFGVVTNLYTVRSGRNWGVGDFTDLGALMEWAAGEGAAFVGLNPLHTLRNRGGEVSPYSPVSRLFRNPLYLDVEAVPELNESRDAQALVHDRATQDQIRRLREGDRVEYEAVMGLKTPVLETLHRVFASRHREADTDRGRLYAAYVADQGQTLTDFATFLAIEEELAADSWREWPEEYQDPRSPAVAAFREAHAERVDYHRWVQFELDTQLRAAAERGRRAGMPVGLYQDLAIGSSPNGADAWLFPGLFLQGASVGAPPDPFAAEGQNWGLPPLDPRALAADGYRYWIQLVRSAMRHGGALRIDHVIGLFQQFWIPEGMSGKKGAYVRFPSEELLGILARESQNARALVVGEDLGTVPKDVPPALERWGVLSSKVLWFEQDAKKRFRAPTEFPARALATANTHDLATIAGFWEGRDVELRAENGLLGTKKVAAAARKERERDRQALLERLVEEGLLPEDVDDPDEVDALELRHAVHAFLRRTPSWLVGLSLDDLTGETDAVNLPGVSPEDYPSWTRKQSMTLEELRTSAAVKYALGVERAWLTKND